MSAVPSGALVANVGARHHDMVERYGSDAVSFLGLKRGFRTWFHGSGACVAYVDTGAAWVAAGAPLAPPDEVERVALAFIRAAANAGRRASFFATERDFRGTTGMQAIIVGEQPVWIPSKWESTLRRSRRLREQLRRARAKGVVVRRLDASAPAAATDRADVERLMHIWLRGRGMAPMGFVAEAHPFARPREQQYWIAERRGRVVGALVAVPIPARTGWVVDQIYRDEQAPNGTAELLIDAAMRTWAAEGVAIATLGLSPLSGSAPRWMRSLGHAAPWLYDFEGLRAFKQRLHPDRWEPVYHAHPEGAPAPRIVLDGIEAFARGSLLRFGARTLLKHPWMALLALSAVLATIATVGVSSL